MGVCGSSNIESHTSKPSHAKRASMPPRGRGDEPYSKINTKNSESQSERKGNQKTLKTAKLQKNGSTTDLTSNKSRTTSASSKQSEDSKVINDPISSARSKEKWYYNYLMAGAEDNPTSRCIIDAEWVNIWVHFIQGGGIRPWNDINKRMYTQSEDGRVRFRVNRKSYIINKRLWDHLKSSYGSQLTFEVREDRAYQVYLKDKMQEVEEEVQLSDDSDSNKSEVDYLPTERDVVYPISSAKKNARNDSSAMKGYGKRMNTVELSKEERSVSILDRIIKSRAKLKLVDESSISALASDDAHLIMSEKEKKEPKRRPTLDHKETAEEYLSQPSCDVPPDYVAPPVGMKNYGTTCYLNATLQCLLCIPEMNTYFVEGRFSKIAHETRQPDFLVCHSMARLYTEVFKDPPPSHIAPRDIVDLPNLCPSGQQDAHEFIWKRLFPRIQDETNPAIKRPKRGTGNFKATWGWYQKNNNSIFDKLFAGLYESKVQCKSCQNVSVTYDPFLDISLPVAKKTLESSIRLHFKDEVLSMGDSYKCEKCQTEVAAIKSLKIAKAPRYLILHLKRLVGGHKKISTFIQYPSVLNITEFCTEETGEVMYNLLSLSVHNGGAQSGHYYAVGRRATKWYEFDDKRVTDVKESDVMQHEAYMLFYLRV